MVAITGLRKDTQRNSDLRDHSQSIGQNMKIFNFEQELNLDFHFAVKFDAKCDGDGPES